MQPQRQFKITHPIAEGAPVVDRFESGQGFSRVVSSKDLPGIPTCSVQSCRIVNLAGLQLNNSAVSPHIDRQPKAGVFLDSFRHCNFKSNFGWFFEWQLQHVS